jgi:nickel transport protein
MDEKDIPRYKTDAQGIASIPLTRSGPYLLVVDHELAPAHPELAAKDRYNATLSFTLP